jgi:hypothetical protein
MNIKRHNLDCYGAPPIEWTRVQEVLGSQLTQAPGTGGLDRHTYWLTTTNPDGSPHVTAVGVMAVNGTWYFTSGPGTRKSRNLARDSRCVVSVATCPFDLVVEGNAHQVTDAGELRTLAKAFADDGWPAEVDGDALTAEYSAPSAGPPPWHLYRLDRSTVFALGTTEPGGATKFEVTR